MVQIISLSRSFISARKHDGRCPGNDSRARAKDEEGAQAAAREGVVKG